MEVYCTRPSCPRPQNHFADIDDSATLKTVQQKYCTTCGMPLILVGRYIPLNLLGRGGFGAAFLARDRYTPGMRRCVVKQFKPAGDLTQTQLQIAQNLFEREAEALEDLGSQHDQIPELFAFFELTVPSLSTPNQEKFFYLVQEFIDGQNLEEELAQKGKFSEAEVLEVLRQILPVLKFVHEHGSIHRDIKLSNIMRDHRNRLYLLDFGAVKQVAKVAGSASQRSTGIYSMGFAPPEQMAGGEIYPSTDLYALAVTCITLLTGKEATELFDAYNNQWNWRPYAQVSLSLAAVLDRMLLPAPNQRFESAQEVIDALTERQTPLPAALPNQPQVFQPPKSSAGLSEPPSSVPVATPPRSAFSPVLVLAALMAIGLVSGGVWWFTKHPSSNLGSINNQPKSPEPFNVESFAQVKNVPNGLFNYGGSTTWAPIRQAVDPAIQTTWPQFQLRYTEPTSEAPGSGTGIKMLLNDQLTFSQSSRPLQDQEYQQAQTRGFTLKEIPVAIDGIAIAVNPSLNLSGLTIAQLKGIYTGKLTNWNQVGGPNLPITPYSRRLQDSGTVEFFVGNILGGQKFGTNIQFISTTTQALRALATNSGAIYYASAPEVVSQCSVKPLPLGRKSDELIPPYQEPFVPPVQCPSQHNRLNAAAFKSGQYPITRQLFVIVKQNGQISQQAGEAYANLLLTAQGQELVNKAGFVSIH